MKESSFTFFQGLSWKWKSEMTCSEYLIAAEQRIEKEDLLLHRFFTEDSVQKVMAEIKRALLIEPLKELMQMPTGLHFFLEQESFHDISRLYRLFKNLDASLKDLAQMFREIVFIRGEKIVSIADEEASKSEVEDKKKAILETNFLSEIKTFYEKQERILTDCLCRNAIFTNAYRLAYSTFLNQTLSGDITLAELLSSESDKVLKKGRRDMTDESVDHFIEVVASLF